MLTDSKPADAFYKKPVGRDALCQISSAAFRTGTFFPLRPEKDYAALVRPLWVTQEAVGHDPGLWYHDPVTDGWGFLANGDYRHLTGPLTRGRDAIEHASAVCAVIANLRKLLLEAGPDAYRLANVEAGLAARRLHLSAASLGFAVRVFSDFYDDAWKQFLHLNNTGWEVLAVVAVGGPAPARGVPASAAAASQTSERASGIIGFKDD